MLVPREKITTGEVLSWQGIHLLHFAMSSCSQKVRILLDEKGINWTSHPVNLAKGEQRTSWFRGINPNAVVPVLVHDGEVHIESNDILRYLDETFPSTGGAYIPVSGADADVAQALLDLEDDLHADLRAITFTHVMPGRLMNEFFSSASVAVAARRFDEAFARLETALAKTPCLGGERVMLTDIAWFISVHRLVLAGFPLQRYPRLTAWYGRLLERPAFRQEIAAGGWLPKLVGRLFRGWQRFRGINLASVPA